MDCPALTPEQEQALSDFVAENGKNWKKILADGWLRAAYPGPLQQVRNQFGPSWLRLWQPGISVFRDLPEYRAAVWIDSKLQNAGEAPLWSGATPPPAIGETIAIKRFGGGRVLGYYTQDHWLGVIADPITWPDWWRARNPDGALVYVFGAEIERPDAIEEQDDKL